MDTEKWWGGEGWELKSRGEKIGEIRGAGDRGDGK